MPLRDLTRKVYLENGVRGFYNGLLASQARASVLGAAYMGTYDSTKQYMLRNEFMKDGVTL